MARSHDDLTEQLTTIAEEVADRAMELLREALERGETGPVAEERRLTRARRSIEKAIHLLEGPAGAGDDD